MSAYSNMQWIEAVRASGAMFVPISLPNGRWQVGAHPEPPAWIDNRYRNVHAVERDFTENAAFALVQRLNDGQNR